MATIEHAVELPEARRPRRPAIVALITFVTGALLCVGAAAVGYRRAEPDWSHQDLDYLAKLEVLGDLGQDAPISNVVRSSDQRVRLATSLVHQLAALIGTTGQAVLLTSGSEVSAAARDRIFGAYFGDGSDQALDQNFLSECRTWVDAVLALNASSAVDGLSDALRPLANEFRAQADQIDSLCDPASANVPGG